MEKETIRSMVSNIITNRETDAMRDFDAAIADKLTDALDHKKQEIASGLGESDNTKTSVADARGPAGGKGLTDKIYSVFDAAMNIVSGGRLSDPKDMPPANDRMTGTKGSPPAAPTLAPPKDMPPAAPPPAPSKDPMPGIAPMPGTKKPK